jgi:transposase
MSVYVGIDVHRKRSQVAVVTEEGKVQLNRNVVNGSEPMLRLIGGLPTGTPVAFEAAFGWGWLAELLESYGFEAHLVHPLRCKAIASARLKNDKADAAILAQLLRADLLPEAWIAPADVRQLRALLRHRASLVRLGTQLRNRIHAVAADFGYDRTGSYWTGPGRGWLAELDLPTVSREIVTDCLAFLDALAPEIERLDGEVRRHATADPRVKALTVLPGVGQFTALMMVAEIGDITRFPSARKLASWAGLTPTVRGSDRTVRHGHIFKMACAGGTGPPQRSEVCDGGGRRAGSAPGAADVRLHRPGHRRVLAGADLPCEQGEPAGMAAPVRRDAGGGFRGRRMHRLAVCRGGTAAGGYHRAPRRAGGDREPAGQ